MNITNIRFGETYLDAVLTVQHNDNNYDIYVQTQKLGCEYFGFGSDCTISVLDIEKREMIIECNYSKYSACEFGFSEDDMDAIIVKAEQYINENVVDTGFSVKIDENEYDLFYAKTKNEYCVFSELDVMHVCYEEKLFKTKNDAIKYIKSIKI